MTAHSDVLQFSRQPAEAVEKINMLTSQSMDRLEELWGLYGTSPEAIVRHFSDDASSYEAAIEEWNLHRFQQVDSTTPLRCICSQPISLLFFVINTRNGNILRLGPECVAKSSAQPGPAQQRLLSDVRLLLKQRGYTGDRRMCRACHNFTIGSKDPAWKVRCLSCFKEERPEGSIPLLEGLPCAGCRRPCLDPVADKKKSYCLECYRLQPSASKRTAAAVDQPVARSADYTAYLESKKSSSSSSAASASPAQPEPVAVEGRCCPLCRPMILKGISGFRFHSLYPVDDPRRYCPATEAVELEDYQRARVANFKQCQLCHEPKVHKGEIVSVCESCRRE